MNAERETPQDLDQDRWRLPAPLLLLLAAAVSWALAVWWLTAGWGLALILATGAAVAAVIPGFSGAYRAAIILLFFYLGHVAGTWVSTLDAVMAPGRPDLMAAATSVVRTAVVLVGMVLAGAGSRLKVVAGRAPGWWWGAAMATAAGIGAWYRLVFFPALGIYAFSWYVEPRSAVLVALLSCLIRATADELSFRGWIQPALAATHGSHAAIWVQALMSGFLYYNPSLQPYGVSGLIVMTGVGLALGVVRARTGGILLGIAALTAVNLAVFWS